MEGRINLANFSPLYMRDPEYLRSLKTLFVVVHGNPFPSSKILDTLVIFLVGGTECPTKATEGRRGLF